MAKGEQRKSVDTGVYEQVRQIVSAALDAVITIDSHGHVLEWNRRAEEIFGWSRAEAIGEPMAEMIVPPAMREGHHRGMEKYLATGEGPILNQRIEISALRRDGSEFPVELTVSPIRIGDELRFSAFLRDITDDKLARKHLEDARQLLESLIDGLNSAVMVEDSQRRVLHVNVRFCELFGIPLAPADLVGTDCRAGLARAKNLFADPEGFVVLVDELIQEGRQQNDRELSLADGRSLELDYVPIAIGENELGHLWHYRDISERKLAESALAERGAQLDSIFSLSPDGFAFVDADGCIQFVNPAFARLTGLPRSTITGSRIAQLDTLLARQSDPNHEYTSMIEPVGNPTAMGDFEDVIRLRHPREAVLKRTVRRSPDSKSERASQVIYLRDVTHETEVDRMKSEFLSAAAHELRTPMASVYGFSELLLSRDYDRETSREAVETIHAQSRRLIELLNELLDLARIEARAGKDFNIAQHDIQAIVRQTVKGLLIPGDPRPVKSTFKKHLPPVMVDRDKIQHALTNVLANAYKYSPQGGDIRLSTSLQEMDDRQFVKIVISDQGIGMKPEQLERIFERFYRADSSGAIPGTGLGMSLVKEVMELHGGYIFVESEFRRGTTVSLLLPTGTDQNG